MDFLEILEVLQTLGICVGALALVVIAFLMFLVITTFLLPGLSEEEEAKIAPIMDESEEPVVIFAPSRNRRRGKRSSKN